MVRIPGVRVRLSRAALAVLTWGLALAVMLTGCAVLDPLGQDKPPTRVEPQKRPAATAPPDDGPPDDELADDEPGDRTEPVHDGETVAASLPPDDGVVEPDLPPLDGLVGLDPEAVGSLFGPPDQTQEEAPARTWTYQDGDCVLRVSFYPDLETLDYRVLSYRVGTAAEESAEDHDATTKRCRDRFRARLQPAPAAGQGTG